MVAGDLRDSLIEVKAAADNMSIPATQSAKNVTELKAQTVAADGLRDAYIEVGAAMLGTQGIEAGLRNQRVQLFSQGAGGMRMFSGRGIPLGAASSVVGPSAAVHYGRTYGPDPMPEIAAAFRSFTPRETLPNYGTGDIAGARRFLKEAGVALNSGGNPPGRFGGFGSGGGGGNDGRRYRGYNDVPGPNFLAGILPGGRRARPAAILSFLGLGVAATPEILPAAAGLSLGATAGAGALLGGVGTLALAFKGLSAAAFTTQKGFDALDPAQQRFVQTLRGLDAGLGKNLTAIAQGQIIPGLTTALHSAFTPASVSALSGGVGAFGGAISGGAQQFGKLFGSNQFSSSFGAVLQADARYLRDMSDGAIHLVDAFVHLQQAAIPLTDWMDKVFLGWAKLADAATLSGQASGGLAGFFDRAQESLMSLGHLLSSFGGLLKQILDVVGFQNALSVVDLFSQTFGDLARLIKANRTVLHDFFAGAVGAAHDMLSLVEHIAQIITPLLHALDSVVKAVGGWKGVIDAAAATWITRMAVMKVATIAFAGSAEVSIAAVGTAAAVSLAEFVALTAAIYAGYKAGEWIAKQLGLGPKSGPSPMQAGTKLHPGPWTTVNGITIDANGKPVTGFVPQGTSSVSANPLVSTPFSPQNAGQYYKTPKQLFKLGLGLPASISNQLLAAQAGHGNLATANAAAYAYYQGLLGKKGLTQKQINSIYGAEAQYAPPSAFGTPNPFKPTPGTTIPFSGLGTIPLGARNALLSAQTRLAGTGGVTKSTPYSSEALRAAIGLSTQLQHVHNILIAQLGTETDGSKKYLATQKEILTITKQLGAAQKQVGDQIIAKHNTSVDKQIAGILGLNGDGGINVQGVKNKERTTLLDIVKGLAPRVRGRGVVAGNSLAAIPGAADMSIPQLIKSLEAHGVKFSKDALADFKKIQSVIDIAAKNHRRLTADENAKITAYLKQIEQNTAKTGAYPNTFHEPTVKELTKGLHGKALAQARIVAHRAEEAAMFGGKIPRGGSVLGYPLTPGGSPVVHVHVAGDMNINVMDTGNGDPKVIAAKVRAELLKTGRRNPTQTRGPQAGKRVGLN